MYMLMKESHWLAEVGNYVSYGIQARDGEEVLCTISDISMDGKRVGELVDRCNRENLSVVHMQDVIEDEFFCSEER